MWLLPSREQWASWSLPSKLTAIGAYAGIIGIPLAIGLFALSAWIQQREASQAQRTAETAANQAARSVAVAPDQRDFSPAVTGQPSPEVQSLSLDDLLVDLNREDLTNLQREQMRERLTDRRVTWRVSVRQVTRSYGGRILLLFIAPSQQSKFAPDLLSATLPAARESSVSALRPGDLAVIEGSLGFTQWGLSEWLPELKDAELLSFSTPPKSEPTTGQ